MTRQIDHFQFISPDEHLEIKIANYLNRRHRFVTVSELSKEFESSSDKIRNILRTLKKRVRSFQDSRYLVFIYSKKQGVLFTTPDDNNLKSFNSYIISQSALIQLFLSISCYDFRSVTNYAHNSYTSESTVRRQLNQIRQIIRRYDLDIAKNSYELIGSETQIRYFLFLFFWRIYRGLNWPFSSINEQSVEYAIISMSKKGLLKILSPIENRRLMFYIAVTRLRLRNKNHIANNYMTVNSSELEQNFIVNFDMISDSKYYPKEEAHFAFKFCLGLNWLKDTFTQFEFERESNSDIYHTVTIFFSNFETKFFKIPSERMGELSLFIFRVHLVASMFSNFDSDMNGFLYDNFLSKYYPNLKEKLSFFINELEEFPDPIFHETDFLLIHYSMLISLLNLQTSFEKKVFLGFDSSLPKSLQLNQIDRIGSYFKNFFNFEIYQIEDIRDPSKIDIIVTSVSLNEYTQLFPNAQVLSISRTVGVNDLLTIEKALLNI